MLNLRSLLLAIVTIAVLAGGYLVFRPGPGPEVAVASGPKVFALAIADNAAGAREQPLFRAEEGDTLRFEITSATEGVLSIHGYPNEARLSVRAPVHLEFAATRAGRFPMHVHAHDGAHLDVGVLQVEPRAAGAR